MKTRKNVFSVHIVTYNNQTTIKDCLISLQRQSYRRFCVCIIDNNSQDQTAEIIGKIKPDTFIKNSVNKGYAFAHNQAIKATESTYVLTLNPDVVLDKFFLKNIAKTFHISDKKLGSASGLLLRTNNIKSKSDIIDSCGLYMRKNRQQGLRCENQFSVLENTKPAYIFGPDGAAALYKREMLEDVKINGQCFDEDFFMHKEDVDICWRAQLRGWKSVFVPDAKCYHIRSFRPGVRKGIPAEVKKYAVRNRYYLIIKNDISTLLFKDIFSVFLYEIKIFFYILIFERTSLAAYIDLFRNIKKMLKKRTLIQSRIKVSPSYMSQWFE